jgi:hypothetical protein
MENFMNVAQFEVTSFSYSISFLLPQIWQLREFLCWTDSSAIKCLVGYRLDDWDLIPSRD